MRNRSTSHRSSPLPPSQASQPSLLVGVGAGWCWCTRFHHLRTFLTLIVGGVQPHAWIFAPTHPLTHSPTLQSRVRSPLVEACRKQCVVSVQRRRPRSTAHSARSPVRVSASVPFSLMPLRMVCVVQCAGQKPDRGTATLMCTHRD